MNILHIPPHIPYSTISNISISVKRSNFTLVFSKAVSHAKLGAERNFAGSSSYIFRHIFRNSQIHQYMIPLIIQIMIFL